MTETPYLIAHKVRGKPAFDIAIQMQVAPDEDPWWIIPTSGHRAYPYWYIELDLLSTSAAGFTAEIYEMVPKMPEGHPDHYSANDGGFDEPVRVDTLRSLLLPKPAAPTPIPRRPL